MAFSALSQQFKKLLQFSEPGRQWPDFQSSLPWYDRPDALESLDRLVQQGELNAEDYALLVKWCTDGYVILNDCVNHELIDRMCEDVDALWTAAEPFQGLQIEEVRKDPSSVPGIAHSDLLQIPEQKRLQIKARDRWRVHGFYRFSAAARELYEDPTLKSVCSKLLRQEAIPHYSINFIYGSRQELHQDTAVFHVFPANHLIGAWIACEDVSSESGPLVYYPKSQKAGFFKQFNNYPQTNLRTCELSLTHKYNDHLNSVSKNYERKRFLAKKGNVLLWNGLLLHGGDVVENDALSRKSFVCHFIPQGMDRSQEVVGPFNWG